MTQLLRGRISRRGYLGMIRSLHLIYEALEEGLERRALHPGVDPVRLPPLYRTSALSMDLGALGGEGWPGEVAPPPTALLYAARLRGLTEENPALLAAHAYTRYMGDLSGGIPLGRIVARALGLHDTAAGGLAFYRFPDEVEPEPWKERLREGLDRLPAGGAGSDALVEEAREAFRLHARLFRELEESATPG